MRCAVCRRPATDHHPEHTDAELVGLRARIARVAAAHTALILAQVALESVGLA